MDVQDIILVIFRLTVYCILGLVIFGLIYALIVAVDYHFHVNAVCTDLGYTYDHGCYEHLPDGTYREVHIQKINNKWVEVRE